MNDRRLSLPFDFCSREEESETNDNAIARGLAERGCCRHLASTMHRGCRSLSANAVEVRAYGCCRYLRALI